MPVRSSSSAWPGVRLAPRGPASRLMPPLPIPVACRGGGREGLTRRPCAPHSRFDDRRARFKKANPQKTTTNGITISTTFLLSPRMMPATRKKVRPMPITIKNHPNNFMSAPQRCPSNVSVARLPCSARGPCEPCMFHATQNCAFENEERPTILSPLRGQDSRHSRWVRGCDETANSLDHQLRRMLHRRFRACNGRLACSPLRVVSGCHSSVEQFTDGLLHFRLVALLQAPVVPPDVIAGLCSNLRPRFLGRCLHDKAHG